MTRIATFTLLLALPLPLLLGACGGGDAAVGPGTEAVSATEEVLQRVGELAAAEEYDEAARLLEEHVARHPGDDRLVVALSQAHRLRNEVPTAVRVVREALAKRPASGVLAVELANTYTSIDQNALAESTLRAARAAGASDGDDLAYRLGVTLARKGEFAEAKAEFERARAAGSDAVAVGYSLAMLSIRDGRHAEAAQVLEPLLELDRDRMDVIRELGRCRLALAPADRGVAERVIGDLDRVLEQNPEDWYAFELLGDAYMVLEDYPAAILHYTEALRFGQNPPRVEDRYRQAVLASRAADRAAGVVPQIQLQEPEWDEPPLPTSLENMEGFYRRQKPR